MKGATQNLNAKRKFCENEVCSSKKMATAAKLGIAQDVQPARLEPGDLLTPEELAARLKVSPSWVFEQTRARAKVRNKNPLPCIRLGKYLRFSWVAVCTWMNQNNG
jgi:hypothetical protein